MPGLLSFHIDRLTNPHPPMNFNKYILLASLLLAFSFPATGQQVGLSMPVLNNLTEGQFVSVPVTVTNFNDIVSVQFVILWDPAVLSFESVGGFNVPDLDILDFGLDQVQDGILRFAWVGPNGGTNRPNGAAIFSFTMQVVGPLNAGTALTFTELPPTTFFEISKTNGVLLGVNDVVLDQGFAAVGYMVSTGNLAIENWPVQVWPNPVNVHSKAWFSMPEAGNVSVQYVDFKGSILYSEKYFLSSGKHGIVIANNKMHPVGLPCYLVLQSGRRRAVVLLTGF